MTPEFSRPERLDAIGEGARDVRVEADVAEREALARRFGLVSVDRLAATFSLRRTASGVLADGRVEAELMQACAATGDPLPARVDEAVSLSFVHEAPGAPAGDEEAELSADALDVLPIENGAIDLGEAAAETMALALDPFARAPDAADALREAGVVGEDEVRPATGLAGLKDLLERR